MLTGSTSCFLLVDVILPFPERVAAPEVGSGGVGLADMARVVRPDGSGADGMMGRREGGGEESVCGSRGE